MKPTFFCSFELLRSEAFRRFRRDNGSIYTSRIICPQPGACLLGCSKITFASGASKEQHTRGRMRWAPNWIGEARFGSIDLGLLCNLGDGVNSKNGTRCQGSRKQGKKGKNERAKGVESTQWFNQSVERRTPRSEQHMVALALCPSIYRPTYLLSSSLCGGINSHRRMIEICRG